MRKIFVLDTNVLIHDPESLLKFEDNHLVISLEVIEELDRIKKGPGEIARSARDALKRIDALRARGNLARGVPLGNGGWLRIHVLSAPRGSAPTDNRIIQTALKIKENCLKGRLQDFDELPHPGDGEGRVILVSKDLAVRIKAESLGLEVEDYLRDKTCLFQRFGRVLGPLDSTNGIYSVRYLLCGEDLFRIRGSDSRNPVKNRRSLEGISPKNVEQACALDALLNPEVEIVALTGDAGTGKTLLALAAGTHQVAKRSPLYEQVLVTRPTVPMGRDLGYLPGRIGEKLAPWMQPIFDNLEVILQTPKDQNKDQTILSRYRSFQYLIDSGLLQVEALAYIRGRSLPRRYFIVDEAQNLRPLDVKTLLTRCGEGTKIVFSGDLTQIDTPHLDASGNGLAYLISHFMNEENFCYLHLKDGVRSRLAEQGAVLL
ncbi:MAG TPA: PhoH family protein [Thermodesulfobacteriota bacterium]|nr:PhoH family protein [Thermodesulfobacteriota bacterium]